MYLKKREHDKMTGQMVESTEMKLEKDESSDRVRNVLGKKEDLKKSHPNM